MMSKIQPSSSYFNVKSGYKIQLGSFPERIYTTLRKEALCQEKKVDCVSEDQRKKAELAGGGRRGLKW